MNFGKAEIQPFAVMGHGQHGAPFVLGEVTDHGAHGVLIEAGRDFVQQADAAFKLQALDDGQTLLFAS